MFSLRTRLWQHAIIPSRYYYSSIAAKRQEAYEGGGEAKRKAQHDKVIIINIKRTKKIVSFSWILIHAHIHINITCRKLYFYLLQFFRVN